MTGHHTLSETERAVATHLRGLGIDLTAQAAVSNLYRAANAIRSHVSKTVLREADLTWTSFVVLWVVWMWDGIETRHAAAEAAISKATLTGVVRTMERRGLLRRSGDPDDRRLVRLSLTDTGRQLMVELFPRFNAEESYIVSRLSRNRLAELTEGLRTIVEHLETAPGGKSADGAGPTA
ncbi:MAG TPA: MarR family winged helix-turn-helix transcriptional regulator [Micromonosporaceae bacterium]